MKITDNIYLLNGAGFDCNSYYMGNGILVDVGSGAFTEEMLQQMENYNIDVNSIKKIILTHSHFDHVGGCKELKEKTNAKVLMHPKAKKLVENGEVLQEEFDADFEPFKIDETLEEGEEIDTGNHKFKVIHTPGHTPGSIALWNEKDKILISGDTLFIDGFGSTEHKNGDQNQLKSSLKKIKELNDIEILLPGHGTPASKRNIYARNKIQEILEQIE
ncbi:MAG: MBL fold metallo-hydrolase [Candidatus Aenigmatarchaeota archaeon]